MNNNKNLKDIIYDIFNGGDSLLRKCFTKTFSMLNYNPYWDEPVPLIIRIEDVKVNREPGIVVITYKDKEKTFLITFNKLGEFSSGYAIKETGDSSEFVKGEILKAFFIYNFRRYKGHY
jgi:hypothetical protein